MHKKFKSKSKITSVLDMYDVVHLNETEFNNIIKKSPNNVRKTMQSLQDFIKEIRFHDKLAHIIPLPLSEGGIYWSDYAGDYLNDIYGEDWYNKYKKGYMYMTVHINNAGTEIIDTDKISVSYSSMNTEDKNITIKLLNKYLKNQYIWSGRNTEKIFISFDKIKTKKIDTDSLKNDDDYPMLYIYIIFVNNIDLFDKDKYLFEKTIKNIKNLIKVDEDEVFVTHGYGIDDMDITFNGISTNIYEKYIKKATNYLNDLKEKKLVKKYSINMYSDPTTAYDTIKK